MYKKLVTILALSVLVIGCVKDPLETDVAKTGDQLTGVFSDSKHLVAVDNTLGITGDSVKSFVEVEIFSKRYAEDSKIVGYTGRVEMHCDKNEFTIITQFEIEKVTGKVFKEDKEAEGKPTTFKEASVGGMLQEYLCKDYTGPKQKPVRDTSQDVTI